MEYKDMIEAVSQEKHAHQNEGLQCINYGRFTVCLSNNIEPFIVDPDIAEEIQHHAWSSSHGYPCVRVQGEIVRLHDFVMAHILDQKPAGAYVDHINQDKLDNRRQNLRIVTPMESSKNMPLRSNNTSGVTGVSRKVYPNGRTIYRSYITINKHRISLGEYQNIQDAIDARLEAKNRYGFDTRPGTIAEKCMRHTEDAFLCELERDKLSGLKIERED